MALPDGDGTSVKLPFNCVWTHLVQEPAFLLCQYIR